jgi:hypothetical protein
MPGEMNMISEIRELNHAELDSASGGMECGTAIAVAKAYVAFGDVMNSLGDSVGAATFYGKAEGVLQGGCAK